MYQPQVSVLSHLLLGLLLAACTRGAEGPSPAVPAPESVQLHWRPRGEVRAPAAEDGSQGLPFEGAADLLAGCDSLPCAAELWEAEETGVQRTLLRTRTTVRWTDAPEVAWPGRWRRLNGALALCLGHPLALPPGGDLGGRRALVASDPPHADPQAAWLLQLSGQNACLLEGALRLSAVVDRVDARALRCEGLPWASGGRERARALAGLSE